MTPVQHPTVFISYRRADSAGHAGRLADSLIARLGRARVFVDVDSIVPGQDFVAAIDDALKSRSECALLVVIGCSWLITTTGDGARRLDLADDIKPVCTSNRPSDVVPLSCPLGAGRLFPKRTLRCRSHYACCTRCNAVVLHDSNWSREAQPLVVKLSALMSHRKAPTAAGGFGPCSTADGATTGATG